MAILNKKIYKDLIGNDNQSYIYNFLLNKEISNEGLYLSEIWKFSTVELEKTHNYIQWLFPTNEKSKYNSKAPVIKDISIFINHPEKDVIKENIKTSLAIMLRFYGLELQCDKIVKSESYDVRRKEWITHNNHNYLRITRILKCLSLFSLQEEKSMFLNILTDIYNENKGAITKKTYQYWITA